MAGSGFAALHNGQGLDVLVDGNNDKKYKDNNVTQRKTLAQKDDPSTGRKRGKTKFLRNSLLLG